MNDLAEKALHGADLARRAVAARPAPALAAVGFVIACVVVVTGGRIGAAPAAVPLSRWLGLLPEAGYRVTGAAMGLVMLAAVALLIALWLLTLVVHRAVRLRPAQVWTIAAAWATPFALGPPLLSTDVYGYVAHGQLARNGLSAYHHPPSDLGLLRIVAAIHPTWRGTKSADGPLATLAAHGVASLTGGTALAGVLVWRLVAIAAMILLGWLTAELAEPRRSSGLALTVLNPAALLVIVSGCNLIGVAVALVLASLVASRQRRWVGAVALLTLAAAVKPVMLVAVPILIAYHAAGHVGRGLWIRLGRDIGVALATFGLASLIVPFGYAWVGNIGDAIHDDVPFAPSSVLGRLIGLVVPAAFDDLQTGARIASGAAAALAVCYLLVSVRTRPLERSIGYALLAVALLAPVVYPSFLMWGVLCVVPTALGSRRLWAIAFSCAACALAPVGLGTTGALWATGAALAVIAAGLATMLLPSRRARTSHDPRAECRDRRGGAGASPLPTSDGLHDDLQHGLGLHGRERST